MFFIYKDVLTAKLPYNIVSLLSAGHGIRTVMALQTDVIPARDLRDKTMDDRFIYIPNHDANLSPLYWLKSLDT